MSADHELPRLSSSELNARFGNDETALRRYRMLVALLREGRAPSEGARTFGVSRESVRRLRHAFEQEGLVALRSRKRGGGHLTRATPLATTIRRELETDPGISSAILWRRVQAQLQEYGETVPRSTFYRLLTKLRGEALNVVHERATTAPLREALNALAEDPPLALGQSELATTMLPDIRDTLQRGRRLQKAMRAAIEQLRPNEAGPVLDDTRWRHYLIIAGEYETGEKRSGLQDALALSASTYSRAKREALNRLAALLPITLNELPPPEPPASLIAPPAPPTVFHREPELDYYAEQLRYGGLVCIWGPTGVGKIDLAAQLASHLQARGQKIVWHSCQSPDENLDPGLSLLSTLAAALALNGYNELWDLFRAPDVALLPHYIELLNEGIAGRHWTVCVANAHWMTGKAAARITEVLLHARQKRDLRLVVVSRQLPEWIDSRHWPPLPFPSDTAARQAFLQRVDEQLVDPYAMDTHTLSALHDRVKQLLATIPIESLKMLSHEHITQILTTLRPVEHVVDTLRAALYAPQTPQTGNQQTQRDRERR